MQHVMEFHGLSLPVTHHSNGVISAAQIYHAYENDEMRMIEKIISATDRVVDFGGGSGWTSLYAALCKGTHEGIYTYEPNPELAIMLKEGVRFDGKPIASFHGAIVCDNRTTARYYTTTIPYCNRLEFTGSRNNITQLDAQILSVIDVPCFHINNVIVQHQANFLIIDIEGYEWELLNHIDYGSITKLMIEFHMRMSGEQTVDTWIQYYASMGFKLIDYTVANPMSPTVMASFVKNQSV